MRDQRAYSKDSVTKLAVHRCLAKVPMSYAGLMLAQQLAVSADLLWEFVECARGRALDRCLPRLPGKSVWLRFYRDHRAVMRELQRGLPGLWPMAEGEDVQAWVDEMRAFSYRARRDPVTFRAALNEEMTPSQWQRFFETSRRWVRMRYRDHLQGLSRTLRNEDWDLHSVPGLAFEADSFDRVLRDYPAVYFYLRVVLPGVLVYQTTPVRELRRLRNGSEVVRLEAVERLVRMDPLAERLPEVFAWMNVDRGEDRMQKQEMVRRWREQGMDAGRFTVQRFKAILGALIQVITERVGRYIDFVNPGLQPASITPAQVRGLFDGVAQDRAGRGRLASLQVDKDLAGIQPGSWARQLRRYHPIMDELFTACGGLKSG